MRTAALIFAGGTGTRMSSRTRPKQFLELNGKPIIIHTLEHFEESPFVDFICVVCLESWIPRLKTLMARFGITKARYVVPGGETGQDSIFNGLEAVYNGEENPSELLMLIHDGVRPLINQQIIEDCTVCAAANGNAITVTKASETIITIDEFCGVDEVIDRTRVKLARAPQCFFLSDIYSAHLKAKAEGYSAIDSATLMRHFGHRLATVEGPVENIKITTPSDYYMARAIMEERENSQIFGL